MMFCDYDIRNNTKHSFDMIFLIINVTYFVGVNVLFHNIKKTFK